MFDQMQNASRMLFNVTVYAENWFAVVVCHSHQVPEIRSGFAFVVAGDERVQCRSKTIGSRTEIFTFVVVKYIYADEMTMDSPQDGEQLEDSGVQHVPDQQIAR